MKIFILEDMYEIRKKILTGDIPITGNDIQITVAASYLEGINILQKNNQYDVWMLDHDLGHPPVGEDAYDGTDFVNYLVANAVGEGKLFIIHSTNPYGSQRMADILNCNGRHIILAPINLVRTSKFSTHSYWQLIQKGIPT